jgi:hypothetical protein
MVEVGEIEKLARAVQRIVPIQSFRQLVSLVTITALISLGFYSIFKIAPPSFVLLGMVAGMYPAFAAVLPSRFHIYIPGNPTLQRDLWENLEGAAFRFGYKSKTVVNGIVYMKPRLPRFLVWDENTVRLEAQQDKIIVYGPLKVSTELRGKILKGPPN